MILIKLLSLLLYIIQCYSVDITLLNDKINYIGRFDFGTSINRYPRSTWSGSSLQFSVLSNNTSNNNISISVRFGEVDSNTLYYVAAVVNNEIFSKYLISSSANNFQLVITLYSTISNYNINLVKITESSCSSAYGIMEIQDITIKNAVLISNESNYKQKKLLFLGDSLTNGYGDDGVYPCSFSPQTENVLHSYASITGEALDAEYHVIAWSGLGVVRNYGDSSTTSKQPLPYYYNRTLATYEQSYYNPNLFQPDLIYIMLGTNDYSTYPQPSDNEFISGYVSFIKQIKSDYLSSIIVLACAPMNYGNQCNNILNVSIMENVKYIYLDSSLYTSYGCDGHPDYTSQLNTANVVIPFLSNLLN